MSDKIVWDNSQELRQMVERELDNWGAWSRRGNRIDLGHPHQIPGATPPDHDPPPAVSNSRAERTEHVISTWCSTTERGQRAAFLLKCKYVERRPLESIATHYTRKFKQSINAERAELLIDEAEWCYWLLTS